MNQNIAHKAIVFAVYINVSETKDCIAIRKSSRCKILKDYSKLQKVACIVAPGWFSAEKYMDNGKVSIIVDNIKFS